MEKEKKVEKESSFNEGKKRRKSIKLVSYYGSELSISEIADLEGISYSEAYEKYGRPTSRLAQLHNQLSFFSEGWHE